MRKIESGVKEKSEEVRMGKEGKWERVRIKIR